MSFVGGLSPRGEDWGFVNPSLEGIVTPSLALFGRIRISVMEDCHPLESIWGIVTHSLERIATSPLAL